MRFTTKLVSLVATVILVSFFTFLLTQLIPGDPVVSVLGPAYNTQTEEGRAQIELVREELGLNDAFPVRYFNWAKGVFTGDLGNKIGVNSAGITTNRILKERLPVTLEIMLLTQIFALLVAIPAGILSAHKEDRLADKSVTGFSFAMLALPTFVIALILVFVFSVKLGWLPSSGYTRLTEDLSENLKSMIIPVLSLGLGLAAVYTRLLRAEMISTLKEDYILMAKAKGISSRRVLLRHALRPSSFALLTIAGINIGALIGGAVIIEQFMAIPGVGGALVQAVAEREYEVILSLVFVISMFYVVANFLVDLLYSFLDPRIRRGTSR